MVRGEPLKSSRNEPGPLSKHRSRVTSRGRTTQGYVDCSSVVMEWWNRYAEMLSHSNGSRR